MNSHEPSDLDFAIAARIGLNLCPFGPLTLDEHEREVAYDRYCEDAELEHAEQQRSGGRTICPKCGERSVTHRDVVTYGYAAHPEAEWSDLATCERDGCDYQEV